MCKSGFFMTLRPDNVCKNNSEFDVKVEAVVEIIPDIYIVGTGADIFKSLTILCVGLLWKLFN